MLNILYMIMNISKMQHVIHLNKQQQNCKLFKIIILLYSITYIDVQELICQTIFINIQLPTHGVQSVSLTLIPIKDTDVY